MAFGLDDCVDQRESGLLSRSGEGLVDVDLGSGVERVCVHMLGALLLDGYAHGPTARGTCV